MVWQEEIYEIQRRREHALRMGGEEKVARQHSAGRLTVRERIELLADPGSFCEIGILAGGAQPGGDSEFLPEPYVGGLAKIDGRYAVVGGEDFTVKGGTEASDKPMLLQRMALEYRVPLVLLHDGADFNIASLLDNDRVVLPTGNRSSDTIMELLATVPVVAGIVGSVAGWPAGNAMLSHWSVMVRGGSELFTAGPPVVKRGIGIDISKQELGGSHIHTRISGAVDNEAEDEHHCIELIKQFLSYLPSNVWQAPPYKRPADSPDRR